MKKTILATLISVASFSASAVEHTNPNDGKGIAIGGAACLADIKNGTDTVSCDINGGIVDGLTDFELEVRTNENGDKVLHVKTGNEGSVDPDYTNLTLASKDGYSIAYVNQDWVTDGEEGNVTNGDKLVITDPTTGEQVTLTRSTVNGEGTVTVTKDGITETFLVEDSKLVNPMPTPELPIEDGGQPIDVPLLPIDDIIVDPITDPIQLEPTMPIIDGEAMKDRALERRADRTQRGGEMTDLGKRIVNDIATGEKAELRRQERGRGDVTPINPIDDVIIIDPIKEPIVLPPNLAPSEKAAIIDYVADTASTKAKAEIANMDDADFSDSVSKRALSKGYKMTMVDDTITFTPTETGTDAEPITMTQDEFKAKVQTGVEKAADDQEQRNEQRDADKGGDSIPNDPDMGIDPIKTPSDKEADLRGAGKELIEAGESLTAYQAEQAELYSTTYASMEQDIAKNSQDIQTLFSEVDRLDSKMDSVMAGTHAINNARPYLSGEGATAVGVGMGYAGSEGSVAIGAAHAFTDSLSASMTVNVTTGSYSEVSGGAGLQYQF